MLFATLIYHLGANYMGKFQPRLSFSPVAWAGKKTRLHGKFQPELKLNVRAGTVVFYIYCCTQGFYACV